ncbi:hypothetical protein GOBAR_DD03977 [Gossypium barbadense]|nr:hypothetical protein GOBAR_DD03977 [Gossypium barbadense]
MEELEHMARRVSGWARGEAGNFQELNRYEWHSIGSPLRTASEARGDVAVCSFSLNWAIPVVMKGREGMGKTGVVGGAGSDGEWRRK